MTSKCKYGICDGTGIIITDQLLNGMMYQVAGKCKCYEDIVQDNMLNFAMIPKVFQNISVKSFDISIYDSVNVDIAIKAKNIVSAYVKKFDEMQAIGKGLFLYSHIRGSGKTRLIISVGNALIKVHKQRTRFITTIDLLGKIKETYDDKSNISEQKLIADFCEIPILILDDIGTERASAWVTEIFFKILDTRKINKKVTLITSNLSIDELQHDERIKSRLRKMCIEVKMPEQDIRNQIGKSENEELINRLLGD
nr:ATP-binding protein [uncultured Cellulosilyticum sp.]